MVPVRWVKDGLSYTYLVGEKFLYSDRYPDGSDGADNEFLFTGWDNDIYRTAGLSYAGGTPSATTPAPSDHAPQHDCLAASVPGGPGGSVDEAEGNLWGSAHPSAFNMVFCDASVHTIPYSIDLLLHRRLHNRADGISITPP